MKNDKTRTKTALIDADVITYQAAYAFQRKDEEIGDWESVQTYIDNLIESIVERAGYQKYRLFLTGSHNFREDIAKTHKYKGNRQDREKPWHYDNIRVYLIGRYEAEVIDYMEADDALAIAQVQAPPGTTVICTIDKDLLQVPGTHYNWKRDELTEVDEYGGWYNLYMQVLCGDRADNIPGIDGIGPTKSEGILEGSEDMMDMHERVVQAYKKAFEDQWSCRFIETMRLLFMVRELTGNGSPIMWQWPDEDE